MHASPSGSALADMHGVAVDLLDDGDMPVHATRTGGTRGEHHDSADRCALGPACPACGFAPLCTIAPVLADIVAESPLAHTRPPCALESWTIRPTPCDMTRPQGLDLPHTLAYQSRPFPGSRGSADRGSRHRATGGCGGVLASGEKGKHAVGRASAGYQHACEREGRQGGTVWQSESVVSVAACHVAPPVNQ